MGHFFQGAWRLRTLVKSIGIRWRTPIGVGSQDGNIVYVLLGAMAATGGIMLLADRNIRSGNEQALEFASEVARERNVAA